MTRRKAGSAAAKRRKATRYRTIHCLVWNDDKFPFVSDDCQLVFFHVLTTPMGSAFGLFKAGMAALAEEKRWDVKRYREGFTEGFRNGFFEYDETTRTVFIPNFLKHNPPVNPNVVTGWIDQLREIPDSNMKSKFIQSLSLICETLPKGFAEAFRKGLGNGMANQEQEQEQELKKPPFSPPPFPDEGRPEQPPHPSPEKQKKEKKPFFPSPGNPGKTPIPPDYCVSDETRDFAQRNKLPDPDDHVDEFIDHNAAAGNLSADWDASFRGWLRRAKRMSEQNTKPERVRDPSDPFSGPEYDDCHPDDLEDMRRAWRRLQWEKEDAEKLAQQEKQATA